MEAYNLLRHARVYDDFLEGEMHRTAGETMVGLMEDLFGCEKSARDWYYSRLKALGNIRPYDFCREGKGEVVKNVLGRIAHGVFS